MFQYEKNIIRKGRRTMFISLAGVVKKYGDDSNPVYALREASLHIDEGEIAVIMGPSGSGKSTLLNLLGGLDTVDSGSVIVNGRDIGKLSSLQMTDYRRELVGFVFQFYNLIPDLTVQENITVISDISENPLDINQIMESLNISELADRFPRELSGGQQQRVAIARALVKNPQILLCDEPTGALDSRASKEVLEYIEKVNREYKTTVIIVTHNEEIAKMADRIIRLKDGRVVADEPNEFKISAKELVL